MVASILLLTVVHFAAFVLLFWHLAGREILSTFRTSDGEGGGGPPFEPVPPDPAGGRGGGLPLPDAGQSPVRLREPRRLADAYPARPRRPDHVPETPERVPAAR